MQKHESVREIPSAITGNVSDSITGEPLAYTIIYIKGTSHGAAADENGNFTLDIPENLAGQNITIVISYVGYSSKEIKPEAGTDALQVELAREIESGLIGALVIDREDNIWGKLMRPFRRAYYKIRF